MRRKTTKRVAKVLLVISILTLVFPVGGCVGNRPFPEYIDDREMMIGGWDSPMNTLEDIQIAKDMGLTHMVLGSVHAKRGTQAYKDALELYEQVGVNIIVQTGSAGRLETSVNDATDYSEYPAVTHINYWDEPFYSNIARIAELAAEHREKYGDDIVFFGNLFPNSASHAFESHTYKEYVKEYADEVLSQFPEGKRYLSADIYPLDKKNGISQVRSNWLGCIETIVLQAKETKAIPHFFIQATEHYTYRAVDEQDIRWQYYVNMAFGVQAFSYFTYADSILDGFEHSCVSSTESAKIHDTYYMAQTVNSEIKSFDHVYLNYQWQGTLPILGKNNEEGYNLNFDGLTASLETLNVAKRWDATEDALVGVFKDNNGNDGLIVTNFTDPANNLTNLVRFEFKDVSKVRVYRGGKVYDYEVLKNRFDIELDPGEGVFIILVP